MHAVIQSGGKQYRVAEGETLQLEKLDLAEGEAVEFDRVMLVSDGEDVTVGQPFLEGGKVSARVEEQGRGDKIEVIKFNRRKKYRRKQGHRQSYTAVTITGIDKGK